MKPIKINSYVGSDGVLRLNVPTEIKNADLEIVLTIKNLDSPEKKTKSAWSPGFFEKTFGAWQGEALKRDPQREYEQREEFF